MRSARRYDIREPVWFRTRESEWRHAVTVNVGLCGALIRSVLPVPAIGTRVRLRIPLPGGWRESYIASMGRVVRVVPADTDGEALVAIEVDRSQLRPFRRPRDARARLARSLGATT
jgi:hypothetical protein